MLRLIATTVVLLASAAVAASAPVATEGVPIEIELREARAQARSALAEQRRLEKAAAEASDEVTRLRARQLAAAQALAVTESRISAADAQARLASAQLKLQRRELAIEQAPLSSLLAGLYLSAQRPPLLLLAGSGSAEEIVKLKILSTTIAPAIRARTGALAAALERTKRLERAAIASREDIARHRDELASRRSALAALERQASELAARRGVDALGAGDVALAQAERFSTVRERAGTTRDSARLASELARLGPAPITPAGSSSAPPVRYRLPSDARVIDGLGAVSPNGIRSRGVTLATKRGARLVVPADGTILFAGPFRDYDGVIIIDHGSGWKSVLVNAGSRRSKGDRVRIGDPLGIALGAVEVQLNREGEPVSPALIAGSSAILSNSSKGG